MDKNTRRRLRWAFVLAILGVIDLVASIHAQASWHPPAGSQASTTLLHVLGFATSVALLAIAATMVVTQVRRVREVQRYELLRHRMEQGDTGLG